MGLIRRSQFPSETGQTTSLLSNSMGRVEGKKRRWVKKTPGDFAPVDSKGTGSGFSKRQGPNTPNPLTSSFNL